MHVKNSNDSTACVRFLHGKYGICKPCASFYCLNHMMTSSHYLLSN